jgi:hypothetical protein
VRAFLLIALAACSPETVARPAPPPVAWRSLEARPAPDAGPSVATEKERAIADEYMRALAAPDLGDLAALVFEDAHFSFAGYQDAYGRPDILAAHEALLGGFGPRSFTIRRVLRTDSAQVIEWTMTGAHKASRKPVAFDGLVLLWTRDDGTISDIHLYFDQTVANAERDDGPRARRDEAPVVREEVEQGRSPEEAANLAAMSHTLDALENDETAYVGAMRDDVEVRGLASAQPGRGQAFARAYFRAMQRAIARLDTQLDEGWGIGRYVVVEYHIVGEQRAPIGTIPVPKDPLIKMYFVDVAEMQGKKIARLWRYDNPIQVVSPSRTP